MNIKKLILVSLFIPLSLHAWNKKTVPTKSELKKTLTEVQYSVTQEEGTEKPFKNEYWNNHAEGIYVDIVSGEPLFNSKDKYESGTGWPSFSDVISKNNITTKIDRKIFSTRTEVRSKYSDIHLGHVFDDGPTPSGQRYCMNSAALRFVPLNKMKEEGYVELLNLFDKKNETKNSNIQTAVFAGGCFWCMQPPYDKLKTKGVIKTSVGYSGGTGSNPTYEYVSAGLTGHYEVIEVTYDNTLITYEKLLDLFWVNIDPYDEKGQFCDKGQQYQSAVFYKNENEKKLYEQSLNQLQKQKKLKEKVATLILPASTFFAAEDYHQEYYLKNPIRYKYYRSRCGRDDRLNTVWGTK